MNEVTTILLENEMDLILANKQSMKLGELVGLGLSPQTTFATAVSEIARTAIERSSQASLTLYLSDSDDREKNIIAVVRDIPGKITEKQKKGYEYARKLVSKMDVTNDETGTLIELRFRIPHTARIDSKAIEKMRIQLNTDPEVSPYEEIKRRNKQLLELSDIITKSEARYRDLTNSLPVHIYTINVNGDILFANNWLLEYTGRTLEELNKTKWMDIVHPDDAERGWKIFFENVNIPKQVNYMVRLKDAQGEYRWHSGIATPVLDDKGKVISYHTYLADIHAQKMIEAALMDNKALKEMQVVLEEKIGELNTSNQQLEQFAYVASHDLQEPLRKISFYSDMLKNKHNDNLNNDAAKLVDNIIKSAERMKILVHDILAYSTLNNDNKHYTLLDLNLILQEALQDLDLIIKEKEASIQIGPLFCLRGNGSQMKQLFENLLSNSLKFTEAGKQPVIFINAEENGDTAILRFKDNGIGFEARYLDKMFHLFQRLHTRDKYSGTGIGLAICKKIVQLHGGTISANSTPGAGAEFIITLPKMDY